MNWRKTWRQFRHKLPKFVESMGFPSLLKQRSTTTETRNCIKIQTGCEPIALRGPVPGCETVVGRGPVHGCEQATKRGPVHGCEQVARRGPVNGCEQVTRRRPIPGYEQIARCEHSLSLPVAHNILVALSPYFMWICFTSNKIAFNILFLFGDSTRKTFSVGIKTTWI